MKKLIIIFTILISFISCKQEAPKDYITITGLIANNEAINIDIVRKNFNKRIKVNLDGTFKDTIKVSKDDFFTFTDGKNKTLIHLKNGDVINIQYDYKNLVETAKFNGRGFETSQYLVARKSFDNKEKPNDVKAIFILSPTDFTAKLARLENNMDKLLVGNIDSLFIAKEKGRNKKAITYLKTNYAKRHDLLTRLAKGKPSPKFENYESYQGKQVSLTDFKGKIVYVDVWATWCGPCKREIPHIKQLAEDFKGQDIEFISISVDNGRGYKNDKDKAKQAWRKMIRDYEMKWLQLYADKAWTSDFVKAYGIRSIPRFILIDKEGSIINAKAPRPSNKQLKKQLIELLN